ncbi:hypothetical protein BDP55DRAFT_263845 [Colletotrichum godetiae]|uniref:Uncharacterized protein n=1 Tax=Colletotrichum godetiae TaxID=1209918 RepID=A0AAJ0F3E0_9PEZI|nr:uncharacterized protein BDP55DRAFT_263845 [Colletotrichum godetiae]KAK1691407.1 hypothetical protein BDP55DRAFT_263845 [Colletotrichum godetiae]
MTSLSIPSQLLKFPTTEREEKVNVQTPGPVAGFSVAASFKLDAELTPPSPLYTSHYPVLTTPYSLSRFPSLPVSFSHCSASATPSSYILIQPTPGHLTSFFFLLTKVPTPHPTGICSGARRGILVHSSPTPLFQRPLMLVPPSIATLRH